MKSTQKKSYKSIHINSCLHPPLTYEEAINFFNKSIHLLALEN